MLTYPPADMQLLLGNNMCFIPLFQAVTRPVLRIMEYLR